MPEIDYDAPLDDDGLEWIRFRIVTVGGQVVSFMVQYETTVGDQRLPVVRYDNSHGFCHRDWLDRRGNVVEKQRLPGSPAVVLNVGKQDIQDYWERYRAAFLGADA